MTSPPFIWDYLQVFRLLSVDTAFRTWCWIEKSTHLISFNIILFHHSNTCFFLLIGRLEWATLNISCCISNSLPLLAPILYFLRAMIFASALHKLLMMTEFSLMYYIGLINFLYCLVDFLKISIFTFVDVILSRRFIIYLDFDKYFDNMYWN